MSQYPFDHIVFDLDDTLLDTFGQLIPKASREACAAMIEAGLNSDLEACLIARDQLARTQARFDLYRNIVEKFGVRENASATRVADEGHRAFHDRKVEKDISLFPGARDLIKDLRSHYRVSLVTAGHPGTQKEKLDILNLNSTFDEILVIDIMKGETKGDAFKKIASRSKSAPERHLSVGNRLDTDIGPAKKIGWKTCWMMYGEYAHLSPHDEFEIPDFRIHKLNELLATCRL